MKVEVWWWEREVVRGGTGSGKRFGEGEHEGFCWIGRFEPTVNMPPMGIQPSLLMGGWVETASSTERRVRST